MSIIQLLVVIALGLSAIAIICSIIIMSNLSGVASRSLTSAVGSRTKTLTCTTTMAMSAIRL